MALDFSCTAPHNIPNVYLENGIIIPIYSSVKTINKGYSRTFEIVEKQLDCYNKIINK